MDAHARQCLRRELIFAFGSLSRASQALKIDYFRLSRILNGWRQFRPNEVEAIKTKIQKEKQKIAKDWGV